ncbi:MAG TPA: PA14 domain-containing protein, partial [Patescibacteria group bacterium]|nr:PA14 domain-containing protein [Patescibacteria group bacterium]
VSGWTAANSGNPAFRLETIPPLAGTLSLVGTTTNSVTLSFTGSSDGQSGLGASPYNFTNTSNWNSSGNTSATTWTNSNLAAGSYTYKVRVSDNAGNYTEVNLPGSVTVEGNGGSGGGTDPWTPGNTQGFGIAVNQNDSLTSTNNVTLQLTGAPSTTLMEISNLANLSDATTEPFTTTKTWDLCAGLGSCNNGTYTVYAKFFNGSGQSSGIVSDSITYQILTSLVPGALSVISTATGTVGVAISGSADATYGLAASPYVFYNRTTGGHSAASSVPSWNDSALTPNTQYTYYAVVTNATGTSGSTADIAAYTLANPPVALATTTVSDVAITLTWSANSNPDGTQYLAANLTTGASSGWISATTATFSGLSCGSAYSFAVQSRNAEGFLAASTAPLSVLTSSCQSVPPSGGTTGGGGVILPPTSSPATTTPPGIVCPTIGDGLFTACYYNSTNLTDPVATGSAASINFNWGFGSPDPAVPADHFSAAYEGDFSFAAGMYNFVATVDDGIRVYLDGKKIIDAWHGQTATTYSTTSAVSAGLHDVRVEYFENTSSALLQFGWLPAAPPALSCPEPGTNIFTSCYFSNKALTDPVYTDTTPNVDYNWAGGQPNVAVPSRGFSARWQGYFNFSNGAYSFSVAADDGVRLYLNNQLVIDQWHDESATNYSISRQMNQGPQLVTLEYYQNTGPSSIKLSWKQLSSSALSCPGPAQGSFTACYFDNADLTNLMATGTTDTIDFNWGSGSPSPLIAPTTFSASWDGVFAFSAGSYSFTAAADDGVRLYLDGQKIIDAWKNEPLTAYTAVRSVSAGSHDLRMEYYQNTTIAAAKLSWAATSTPVSPLAAKLSFVGVTATSVTVSVFVQNMPAAGLSPRPYVYTNLTANQTGQPTAAPAFYDGLLPDSDYTFQARVLDADGNSVNTEPAVIHTLTVQTVSVAPPPTSTPPVAVQQPAGQTPAGGSQGGISPESPPPAAVINQAVSDAAAGLAQAEGGLLDGLRNLAADTNSVLAAGRIGLGLWYGEAVKQARQGQVLVAEAASSQKAITGLSAAAIAPTTLTLEYALAAQGIMPGLSSLSDLWLYLLRLLYALLGLLGLRLKRRYWGTVYDSKTKQPLDPAIVELVDAASGRMVDQAITDMEGRFGFLDKLGKFYLRVRKTHYSFPSKLVTGRSDGVFDQLYHGEILSLAQAGKLLSPNIPMDQEAFDWNQKDKQRLVRFYPKLELAANWVLQIMFWSGFVWVFAAAVAEPRPYNLAFFAIYAVLILLKRLIPQPHLWGRIAGHAGGLSGGLVIELSPPALPGIVVAKAMTTAAGRFFLKAQPGTYLLKIRQIEGDKAKIIYQSHVKVGSNGVVNRTLYLD